LDIPIAILYYARVKAKTRIALVGLPASGKSTVGKALASILGLPFLDSDAQVVAEACMGVPAIFAAEGEAGFRARESRALASAASGPPCVLATGGGAVISPANRELLALSFETVWLRVGPEAAALRAAAEPGSRPLLAGADAVARIRELASARGAFYAEVASLSIETEGRCPEEIARDVAGALAPAIAREDSEEVL
jgi:shikimate kinase